MGLFDIFFKRRTKTIKATVSKKKKIKATTEGDHEDVLSTSITGRTVTSNNLKKNAYRTYRNTVNTIYDMYNGNKDFGGEFLKSIARTRVSFIAGGGLTVIAEKIKTEKWLSDFFEHNKMLEGSRLFNSVMISELAGKCLLIIKPNNKIEKIDVRIFYDTVNPYEVEMDEKDNQIIKDVKYTSEMKNGDKAGSTVAPLSRLVYIKTGGSPDKVNETMPTIGNCLTDVENASRIKYDLRYNNHLYGRITPAFKTETKQQALALNNILEATGWEIGKAYCGTAELKLIGPPPGATDALTKELQMANRIISLNTGIPIHWLAWPDLMSNRATAENLMEVINSATIMEREIWEESLMILAKKAMALAFERGYKDSVNDQDGFIIKLPLISIAKLKEIEEVWIPLETGGYITKDSVRNKIPGINPLYEKKMIEKQKNEDVKNIKNKFKNDFDHKHDEGIEEEEEVVENK